MQLHDAGISFPQYWDIPKVLTAITTLDSQELYEYFGCANKVAFTRKMKPYMPNKPDRVQYKEYLKSIIDATSVEAISAVSPAPTIDDIISAVLASEKFISMLSSLKHVAPLPPTEPDPVYLSERHRAILEAKKTVKALIEAPRIAKAEEERLRKEQEEREELASPKLREDREARELYAEIYQINGTFAQKKAISSLPEDMQKEYKVLKAEMDTEKEYNNRK